MAYIQLACEISAGVGLFLALSFVYRPTFLRGARWIIPYFLISATALITYFNRNESGWDVLIVLILGWGICGLFHLLGWLADKGILNRDKF
jgi:hypothetical protein